MADVPSPHRPGDLIQRGFDAMPRPEPMAHPAIDAMLKRIMAGEIDAQTGLRELQQTLNVPPPPVGSTPFQRPPEPQARTSVTSAPELNAEDFAGPAPMSPALENAFAAGDPSRSTPRPQGTVPQPPQAAAPFPGPQNESPNPTRSAVSQLQGTLTSQMPVPGGPPPRPTLAGAQSGLGAVGGPLGGQSGSASASSYRPMSGLGMTGLPGMGKRFTQSEANSLLPTLTNMMNVREQGAARRDVQTQRDTARTELEREKMRSREALGQLAADSKYAGLLVQHQKFADQLGLGQVKEANDAAADLLRYARAGEAIASRQTLNSEDWMMKMLALKENNAAALQRAQVMAGQSLGPLLGSPMFVQIMADLQKRIDELQQQAAAQENVMKTQRGQGAAPAANVETPLPSAASIPSVQGTPPIPAKKVAPKPKAAAPKKATASPEAPAPLPLKDQLVKGRVYQTSRGPARWNGSAFELVR